MDHLGLVKITFVPETDLFNIWMECVFVLFGTIPLQSILNA